MCVQVSAIDDHILQVKVDSATAELPKYVECQTNIVRMTKQLALTAQEMVGCSVLRTGRVVSYHVIESLTIIIRRNSEKCIYIEK